MVVIRMVAMGVTPLDPPATMIPLIDPTVTYFGTGMTPTRDLFFSGHTATMLLLALTVPSAPWRTVFGVATAAVALSVLAQHAHYTVDVLAAPFFAYGAYRLVLLVRSALSLPDADALPETP
jgi:membrane-associated phospholipid phosphatase